MAFRSLSRAPSGIPISRIAEMILRQIVQNRIVDGVLEECPLILFEAKAPQPLAEVHDDALTCGEPRSGLIRPMRSLGAWL